jgi:pyrroloquinoline quinone biosynthesis protein E
VTEIAPPLGLLAELTHRCPLACPYCSNPLELEAASREMPTAIWKSVLSQAAELGVLQIHLSGGEPAARRDLEDLVAHGKREDLYLNLITSGVGLTTERLRVLASLGLDHVQLSVQDTDPLNADRIAGYRGAMARKLVVAKGIIDAGLLLTINAVVHRSNVARAADIVSLAHELGAHRVEIAHAQYYGWALQNRSALMPERDDALRAIAAVEKRKDALRDQIVVDHVLPDYYATRPKACVGGWGAKMLSVTPGGRVLPCHSAQVIAGLEFWNVQDHALGDIWRRSPAFNAFRGTDWMQEPCRSCTRREIDHGGCRCQAMMLTGDPKATDPACSLSPHHEELASHTGGVDSALYQYRRLTGRPEAG